MPLFSEGLHCCGIELSFLPLFFFFFFASSASSSSSSSSAAAAAAASSSASSSLPVCRYRGQYENNMRHGKRTLESHAQQGRKDVNLALASSSHPCLASNSPTNCSQHHNKRSKLKTEPRAVCSQAKERCCTRTETSTRASSRYYRLQYDPTHSTVLRYFITLETALY
eukprot:2642028-Rhodomonas_salina.2